MSTCFHAGKRVSYDGNLCTVRYQGALSGTEGDWLGVEWDDVQRGKHDGSHRGRQIFQCLSTVGTPASFVRPTRKSDPERTVLEAIKFKYVADSSRKQSFDGSDVVVISGKVAEEVGFKKIEREQSRLSELQVVILDKLSVNGVAPRGSSRAEISQHQRELRATCPNVVELDIGWNLIETWQDVSDICSALPKLRILRACGLRLRSFDISSNDKRSSFANINELYMDECLTTLKQSLEVLKDESNFPALRLLSLSRNALDLSIANSSIRMERVSSIQTLSLENNSFSSLECLPTLMALFPLAASVSMQGNAISSIGIPDSAHSFKQTRILNLSHNKVDSYDFVDNLPRLFPNLESLRISHNPLYLQPIDEKVPQNKASERSYYLTLARIPGLKNLNYTQITPRDREEGEIYYLSIEEKKIQSMLTQADASQKVSKAELAAQAAQSYARYQELCSKYHRESLIDQYLLESEQKVDNLGRKRSQKEDTPKYPAGSLGARLVNTTFQIQHEEQKVLNRLLPRTLPVNSIKALLVHEFPDVLQPLQFRLIYESRELDPVDLTIDSSSRSHAYGKGAADSEQTRAERWQEWGDWDADAMVEVANHTTKAAHHGQLNGNSDRHSADEHWTSDGFLIKDGQRWKRRDVEILGGMRSWGDWIEDDTDSAQVRIEKFSGITAGHQS